MLKYTVKTLNAIRPGARWSLSGDVIIWEEILDSDGNPTGTYKPLNLEWNDETDVPSKEEFDTAYSLAVVEVDSLEYQRLRQPEYPPLADLADALYWQAQGDESKMTAYLAAVEAVKQKYPKGV